MVPVDNTPIQPILTMRSVPATEVGQCCTVSLWFHGIYY